MRVTVPTACWTRVDVAQRCLSPSDRVAEGHDVSIHALSRHQTGERAANALAEASKFNS
jgi:hypothetical protein